jgi:hypothetical protein
MAPPARLSDIHKFLNLSEKHLVVKDESPNKELISITKDDVHLPN